MIKISSQVMQEFRHLLKLQFKMTAKSKPPLCRILTVNGQLFLWGTDGESIVILKDENPEVHEFSVSFPYEMLSFVETKWDSLVAINNEKDQVSFEWEVQGVPYRIQREITEEIELPTTPVQMRIMPVDFLATLSRAGRFTDPESSRYALGHIQLSPKNRWIAASDGRQAYLARGFKFPFDTDELCVNSRLWSYKLFQQAPRVSLGQLVDRLVVNIGLWWIYLPTGLTGRFPDINLVFPAHRPTKISLHHQDAEFLINFLQQSRLAGDEIPLVTLISTTIPQVRLRTETGTYNIQLTNSSAVGPEFVVVCNREHLLSALKLGFRELELKDEDSPICCFQEQETYLCMPFSQDSKIKDETAMIQVSSPPAIKTKRKRLQTALSR